MKWSSLIPSYKPAKKHSGREKEDDKDPAIRFLQGGLIATFFLWGV
jgi:hypothetical protein